MCEFWSAVVSRTGKVYHLGEITSHEKIIEHFKLSDSLMGHICRVEIPILNGFNLKPKKEWKLKVDEIEIPSWWKPKFESVCFEEFEKFYKKDFCKKWKRFKKLNGHNEQLTKMTGEQIIHRTKLLSLHEKLIVEYYLLGEKESWDSVRDSVWGSVRGSVWDSVWGSVWDSVRDSVRDSVWGSVWGSVRDSVRDSVWDSVRDSVWDSVRDSVWGSQFPNKPYPLALPKKIFDLGYIHCLVKEKDSVSRIHVYGKRGKLLKKIDFKDKKGKLKKELIKW